MIRNTGAKYSIERNGHLAYNLDKSNESKER
jgi:hypothetical protein